MTAVLEVNESQFSEKIAQAKGLVIVDFSAVWCGPCRSLAPELEAVAQTLGDNVTVVKVDVDESPNLAMKYGVQGIPNLTFIKDGQVVDVAIGAIPRAAILNRARALL